jgi:hypothetical protein
MQIDRQSGGMLRKDKGICSKGRAFGHDMGQQDQQDTHEELLMHG